MVLAACAVGAPVQAKRQEAPGLVLASDVVSSENVPPFANTAVDGYAVRSSDLHTVPVELLVIGELAAGAAPSIAVTPGTAIRIMTGAPLPDGCDAVVMVEDTERVEATLCVFTRVFLLVVRFVWQVPMLQLVTP